MSTNIRKLVSVLIASFVLAITSPVSVCAQEGSGKPESVPIPEFAVPLRQAELLCERAKVANTAESRKQLASEAKSRLLPFLTNPDEGNINLWRVVGLVGLLLEDTEWSAFAFEAIVRLRPDYAVDDKLLTVIAELDLLPIRESVNEIRAERPETARLYKGAQVADAFAIAKRYEDGKGVIRNAAAARAWTQKAAEAGEAEAMLRLGAIYANGKGVQRDFETAFGWYSKAAEAKNADAMCDLGIMYEEGEFVAKDVFKAVEWYTKSAEGASVRGMRTLARHYASAGGPDSNLAITWYTKAADLGDGRSMCDLGLIYEQGRLGIAKDAPKAAALFAAALQLTTKAASNGDTEAMISLSNMYLNGNGVLPSEDESFKWLSKAADAGNANAMKQLARAYLFSRGVAENRQMYFEWMKRAAEAGNASAIDSVGDAYTLGTGVAVDKATALVWYEKAAAAGESSAMFSLAKAFLLGEGTARDETKALEWLTKFEARTGGPASWRSVVGEFIIARKGAENGEALGLRQYAALLKQGNDLVEIDPVRAAEMLDKSVGKGDVVSAVMLGRWLLTDKEGLTPDIGRSVSLFRRAAELGYAPGMLELARRYAAGQGVESDGEEAEHWYRAASKAPVPKDEPEWSVNLPLVELASFYDQHGHYAQARRTFEEVAGAGGTDPQSLYARVVVGSYLRDDAFFGRDDQGREKAFALFKSAAEAGYPPALYFLGESYDEGLGIAVNKELAVQALERAIEHANYAYVTPAHRRLGRLFETGCGVPRNLSRALKRYQEAVVQGSTEAEEDVQRVLKLLANPSASQLTDAISAESSKISRSTPPSAIEALRAAEAIANTLANDHSRAQSLYNLTALFAKFGDIPNAKRIAAQIPFEQLACKALVAIACEQIDMRELSGARDTLQAARAALPRDRDGGSRQLIAELASTYAKVGDTAAAQEFVSQLVFATEHWSPNRAIVASAVREGKPDLTAYAISLAQAAVQAQARETGMQSEYSGARSYIDVLCGLAEAQAANGDRRGAMASLDAANVYIASIIRSDPSDIFTLPVRTPVQRARAPRTPGEPERHWLTDITHPKPGDFRHPQVVLKGRRAIRALRMGVPAVCKYSIPSHSGGPHGLTVADYTVCHAFSTGWLTVSRAWGGWGAASSGSSPSRRPRSSGSNSDI